jgi:hypothetical protein
LDNAYHELVSRFDTLENALDFATELDKEEISYPETGFELCKRVIKLPKRYASASKTAAQWGGALGQLTDNKYAAAQARSDSRDKVNAANRRLNEIAKASLIIERIKEKYYLKLSKIDASHYSVSEFQQLEIEKENNTKMQAKNKYVMLGFLAGLGVMLLFIQSIGSLLKGTDIGFVIILLIVTTPGLIGGYLGYLLYKRKHK